MQPDEASQLVSSLFETWGPTLYRYACRESGMPLIAEDLVQEAFFSLLKELRSGRVIDNPRAWTTTVVQFQARKFRRDTDRHRASISAAQIGDFSPARMEQAEDDLNLTPQLLSVLSQREQQVLELRLQSLKYEDIGRRVGISAKSVATFLARALRKMKAVRESETIQRDKIRAK